MTNRLDAFTDAAFAFAVTLLVIGGSEPPTSVAMLRAAMAEVPAFAIGFAIIAMFWFAHVRWRHYRGEGGWLSMLLSVLLIFLVLIYVQPLRGDGAFVQHLPGRQRHAVRRARSAISSSSTGSASSRWRRPWPACLSRRSAARQIDEETRALGARRGDHLADPGRDRARLDPDDLLSRHRQFRADGLCDAADQHRPVHLALRLGRAARRPAAAEE